MDRREFIKLSAAGVLVGNLFRSNSALSQNRLQLIAAEGEHRFVPDQVLPTRVMQYNQTTPGPTIRLAQSQTSEIEFINQLNEASTVHWHGLRLDNAMDGVADLTQPPVMPGESFVYRLTPPDAGTYWYHTHMRSWAQQALGLAGVLIVEEGNPPQLDQDLICAIDDWRLDDALQFHTDSLGSMRDWSHQGRIGNVFSVNGKVHESFEVASGERIRLRLVNIANARVMRLLIHEPRASIIAVDGQPVTPEPLIAGRLTLAPGGRLDLMLDMTGNPGEVSLIELLDGDYAYEIARFEYQVEIRRSELLETSIELPPNPMNQIRLPEHFESVPLSMQGGAMSRMEQATYQGKTMGIRELVKLRQIWALNGNVGMPSEPLFRVSRGTPISLEIDNDTGWPHAMHLHGHHCQTSREPDVWRDTVLFERAEKGSMRFIADNPGKWLIHCHMVEHMAGGMVTWFEVT